MRLRLGLAMGLVIMGCGGSAAQQPAVAPAAPKVETARTAAADARSASDELRKRWPFTADPTFVLYGDLAGLVKTELVTGLVPPLLALTQNSLSDVQRECVRRFIEGAREIAVGANDPRILAVIRFDEGAMRPDSSACLKALGQGQPAEVPGATAAVALDHGVLALQPGFLFLGTEDAITEALKGEGAARWPTGLDLPKDTHLRWRARMPDERAWTSGSFASAHDFFHVEIKTDLESELSAKSLESNIAERQKELAARIATTPTGKSALRIFDAVRVTREGGTLNFFFDLREPPVEQAHDVGIIAGVAISGVRKYLLAAKLGEARATLQTIAKSEVDAFRDLPAGRRKLASLPAVPKDVPHGMKYQSAASDWKPWSAVKFSLGTPQYFQYEVVATKDGKHASIIARGDLNGDGKSSELTLKVEVNPKSHALDVAQRIEEKDPEE